MLDCFIADISLPLGKETTHTWILFVDSASNLKVSGANLVLEGPNDLLIEKSLKFEFKAKKNQVEYEVLVTSIAFSLKMDASSLKPRNNSQLVKKQVIGEY